MRKRFLQGLTTIGLALVASPVFAEEAAAGASSGVGQWAALAAGFGLAIAASCGALAQGRAVASALEGIARNPNAAGKIMTPMILGLALIESLVIYMLVIAFILIGKI
jgi:F-type H+-transporting ATPase subunit c